MLVKGFTDGSSMFDVTPVENVFITEYMMRAPGDYVKVYLFLLNICYYPHDDYNTKDVAKELGMDEDEVKKALVYWAQLSLIEIESRRPFSVKIKNIKQMLQNEKPQKNKVHNNQDLIMQIQQSFGGRRLLNTSDTKKMLNWAQNLKWSPEMIALVVAWCIENKGRWVHFSYIDTVITSMHEQGIDNYDKAEKYLIAKTASESGATKLLESWNENRSATADEILIYKKWTDQYEMSEGVIIQARKQMVGIGGNKFKYLDGILTNWHNKGIRSSSDIQEHLDNAERVKEINKVIYNKTKFDEAIEKEYTEIIKLGFSHKVLMRVAIALKQDGLKSIEDFHKVITKWVEDGITDDEMLMDKLDSLAKLSVDANNMISATGENRTANLFEKRAYIRWIKEGHSSEEILNAAKQSINSDKKIPYINAILNNSGKKSAGKAKINIGDISHEYGENSFNDILSAMEEM